MSANPPNLAKEETGITGTAFKIKRTKLYALVVTLYINNNIKFLEQLKQGIKRTISWNKYRSKVTKKPKSNN